MPLEWDKDIFVFRIDEAVNLTIVVFTGNRDRREADYSGSEPG